MIVENKINKLCCFYVSEFHLEMILIPYINKKIEENIIIKTEKNLKDTIEILVSRINLNKENKNKILNLGWDSKNTNEIKNESNIIIIGSKRYIESVNIQIKEKNIKNANVVDCYNFEEVKDIIDKIKEKYEHNLNTTELIS